MVDAGNRSTEFISIIGAVSAIIYLNPDILTQIMNAIGVPGQVTMAILAIAGVIWNYRNPRKENPESNEQIADEEAP